MKANFRETRKRIKAILKFGIAEYFRARQSMKHEAAAKFPHFLSALAIIKNEGIYLRKWLEFHMMNGVEKFFIYDNESTDDTAEILKPYVAAGIVEYIFWPGKKQQIPVYNDGIKRARTQTKWLAIFDLDEFFVPTGKDDIAKFPKTVPANITQILSSWDCFGSNGHKTRPEGLVLENYTLMGDMSEPMEREVKAIVNPRAVVGCMYSSRYFVLGDTSNTDFEILKGHDRSNVPEWNKRFPKDKLKVNHYWVKSYDEFMAKKSRGRAMRNDLSRYSEEAYHRYNVNLEHDPSTERFIPELKRRMSCSSCTGPTPSPKR